MLEVEPSLFVLQIRKLRQAKRQGIHYITKLENGKIYRGLQPNLFTGQVVPWVTLCRKGPRRTCWMNPLGPTQYPAALWSRTSFSNSKEWWFKDTTHAQHSDEGWPCSWGALMNLSRWMIPCPARLPSVKYKAKPSEYRMWPHMDPASPCSPYSLSHRPTVDHHEGLAATVEVAISHRLYHSGNEMAVVLDCVFRSPQGKFTFNVYKISSSCRKKGENGTGCYLGDYLLFYAGMLCA